LSDLGREQALLLGERLKKLGFTGAIYASPYRRTSETADVIAATLGATFYPQPAIREYVVRRGDGLSIDGFVGQRLDDLRTRFSHLAADAALPHPWWTTESEDSGDVEARVRPFLDSLIRRGEGDALLVGHGASVGACVRYLLRDDHAALASMGRDWYCHLTAIRVAPRVEPLLLTDVEHLQSGQITDRPAGRQ
jgi:broad specificity phosphatase PhoE